MLKIPTVKATRYMQDALVQIPSHISTETGNVYNLHCKSANPESDPTLQR
jgi:hypothetical protein